MSLYRIIYTSAAIEEFAETSLEELMKIAVSNNLTCQVTGLLLYSSGSFMQVLEGSKTAVLDIFLRIEEYERHGNIFVLEEGYIEKRDFGRFSMGFRTLGKEAVKEYP